MKHSQKFFDQRASIEAREAEVKEALNARSAGVKKFLQAGFAVLVGFAVLMVVRGIFKAKRPKKTGEISPRYCRPGYRLLEKALEFIIYSALTKKRGQG